MKALFNKEWKFAYRSGLKKLPVILFLFLLLNESSGQPYKNPELPTEERIKDLLARMTPEEKFWQLFMIPGDLGDEKEKFRNGIFGFQVYTSGKNTDATEQLLSYESTHSAYQSAAFINEIQRYFIEESRLGIPIIPFDEALHGLIREGATSFPQAIGLAATWDTALMYEVAQAIAAECKTRGIRQVLSPVVNIASDVRWGRVEETYGEDPFLATAMGVAFVSAFEQNQIITTPKHFITNVGDGGRDSYPVHWNERLMHEIYFSPFEACIKKGGARSLMTSYNSYDGIPCTANEYLLNQLLKNEWNFKGFVISDAGSTGGANVLHMTAADYPDATNQSITAGLDVIFQTSYNHYLLFSPPFYDGTIDQQIIDKAVSRVLHAKFELGLFENPYVDPELAMKINSHPDHRKLARKAACESIVLLKNDNDLLPLSKKIKTLTVIGQDATEARLGGYSRPGNNKVNILDGIKNAVSPKTKVQYSPGCRRENKHYTAVPPEWLSCTVNEMPQRGLKGEYYDNVSFYGEPVFTRVDEQINFQWTLFSPDPQKLSNGFYSVRWSGKLTSPETGTFSIGIDGNDGYRLYLDGNLILDKWIKRTSETQLTTYDFEKNREYDLLVEYYEPVGNSRFSLIWDAGLQNNEEKEIEEAVALAAKSSIAVIVAGIEEGEFRDRAILKLPGRQEELIHRVAATGTPMVVVLVGGSAITMSSWLNEAESILAVWYPGEEGGNAVADILFGDYNPAGRLPITYPVSEGQLPLVYNHKPTGRGDDYLNLTGQPLFPFGFGLSYTIFQYSAPELTKSHISTTGSSMISLEITNTGSRAGDEIVQLYLRDELASVARPIMELKGFQRISLKPQESRRVVFQITPEMLSMYDKNMKKIVEPGNFSIMIGASSKDIRQKAILTVTR
ncbi:MAG: beta-glucosidase [Sphingobacteriia bacterium]|nr:beta-glucosidase [Sphingobacteriia bacterium]